MTDKTKCPNGHAITWTVDEDGQGNELNSKSPSCRQCNLVGTHYNGKDLEVMEWTKEEVYRMNCERMQDEIDAAFDNQYFNDEGW